ncbi:acetyl esterase/lipase [Nitrospirillum amazonense]|uniref:Acetyl esterase/lipase n=1 Tax=Nitrospirillum amazonense TaxID=28077 RepID=A0A560FP50_9PROT|nr:alpha/beta hydrolase [Nitrospirillum amazonense]TWB23406.1 acetyl esterase/lipase [Nitrospirillum amazonense]
MRRSARNIVLGITAALFVTAATAQTSAVDGSIIPLYPQGTTASLGVPEIRERRDDAGGLMIRNVSEPTLELFRPAPGRANGTAVIVAPGGGFVGLGYDAEGTAVARALALRGVTAFVLKYRTILSPPNPTELPEVHMKEMDAIMKRATSGIPVEVPLFAGEKHAVEDGARAMVIVRQRASEWGIDPKRVGFLGFSAGGFLAADLAIGDKASRPDFVGLIYGGLRTPVPTDAPPAFIAAAADDEFLPNDSVQLYAAWRREGVAAELHVYEHGGHGFGLRPKGTTSDHWFDEFVRWMQSRSLMGPGTPHPG